MKILVTGSAGLIGSETVEFYAKQGWDITGIDNNMRQQFFGKEGNTDWRKKQLIKQYPRYTHIEIDIRNKKAITNVMKNKFDLIVHAAAQPSHDWAKKDIITDFEVNVIGTLNLLEGFRNYSPEGVFVFCSTNKVYGDNPNKIKLIEKETRLEPENPKYIEGIDETMSIDDCTHSFFGCSKVAADQYVLEYGKNFGLNTGLFRGGCLTGPAHSATEQHGFLGYLVKCVAEEKEYTIYGHKGKQVRDNIHSKDFVQAINEFFKNPKQGEAYNMGGSRHSHISMIEAIQKVEEVTRKKLKIKKGPQRIGDHAWYVSNVNKFKKNYPEWDYTYDIDDILEEMCGEVLR